MAGVGCGLDEEEEERKEEGGRREGGPADTTWDPGVMEEEERGTRGGPTPGDCCIMGGGILAPPTGDPAGPTGGPGSPGGLPLTRQRQAFSHQNNYRIIILKKKTFMVRKCQEAIENIAEQRVCYSAVCYTCISAILFSIV